MAQRIVVIQHIQMQMLFTGFAEKNKTKMRFVTPCKQEITSSHCKAEHEQSNLGHAESKNPLWERIPMFFPMILDSWIKIYRHRQVATKAPARAETSV